ncbi:hypothetical protein K239x_32960 [Planctomycetes bacterium K23_9]|uniref:Uncharacterized protein n=1 Tax=Stieleria marina TaxID=1930275 RepID=A0A517NW02_9BACT|nr:hypothetical protein K239x_32960 [Planctomycetes bacterium K23_9]
MASPNGLQPDSGRLPKWRIRWISACDDYSTARVYRRPVVSRIDENDLRFLRVGIVLSVRQHQRETHLENHSLHPS